jgi:hypothetical protein
MRHVILISGKDSLAAALAQVARAPGLPYEFLFNDVGAELPETYAWLARVEAETGWALARVGADLRARIRRKGGFLPSRRARYCTPDCKIEPTEAYVGRDECTVYYGLRADEPRTGYVPVGKPNITPAYPLRDLGVDLRGVFSILDARGLMPPDFFWPRLYEAASARLAPAWPGWEGALSRLERRLLFAGRTRANCFFCFFQRRYELLWLRETHPDLYAEARALERDDYSFREGFPLAELEKPEVRERLFERRVAHVCEVVTARFQGDLFGEPPDNELGLTSCGLLCGK